MQKLPRKFYSQNTILVAQELLGKFLINKKNGIIRIGKIVEVEAYLGAHDLAAHSCRGITKRTQIMYGDPGYAYVYLIYGMYHCMNIVTEPSGQGSAVLIRALEPIKHLETRTTGPGLLCQAMSIDKTYNGQDLLSNDFYVAAQKDPTPITMVKTTRVGVDYAGIWAKKKLRFYIKNNPYISRK